MRVRKSEVGGPRRCPPNPRSSRHTIHGLGFLHLLCVGVCIKIFRFFLCVCMKQISFNYLFLHLHLMKSYFCPSDKQMIIRAKTLKVDFNVSKKSSDLKCHPWQALMHNCVVCGISPESLGFVRGLVDPCVSNRFNPLNSSQGRTPLVFFITRQP